MKDFAGVQGSSYFQQQAIGKSFGLNWAAILFKEGK